MRNLLLIDALFPKTRVQILATLLADASRSWYLSDLAKHLGTTPSTLQRELASLVDAGILLKIADGNRTYYKADIRCPVFPELRGLLLKTSGLVGQVTEALEPLGSQIQVAFIYGSVASGREETASDVDLMVVGPAKLAEIAVVLRPVETRLARSINPTLYSEVEFAQRVRDKNHFVSTVLEGQKLFIIRSEDVLNALVADVTSPLAR